jgi:hypothetical protein
MICPCCKRAIPRARSIEDRRLVQDTERAQNAIVACDRALINPWFSGIRDAIESERQRLTVMLTDSRLLWSTYRRSDKDKPYFEERMAA